MNKALFLDRDGVINNDYGYVYKIKDFVFIDNIFKLTKDAADKKYLIFVVTNQSGIGRGLYSIDDFNILSKWMCDRFLEQGVLINGVYNSPYHPIYGVGKYKKDDNSRKPKSGMIYKAQEEFNIDLKKSILIGDKITDIEAGHNAGIGTNILYLDKNDIKPVSDLNFKIVNDLCDAKLFLHKN
tara:strand:- start:13363 stop:13911 length:549 start_codon:yes stop_codon:yes gene_type:complete